jgi:capsular polysaccharide biosynthesis protein
MINTYKDLIRSNYVLDNVSRKLQETKGINYSGAKLKEIVSVNQSDNSQMFSVDVVTSNAHQAMEIANTTASVFQSTAGNVLNVDKITIVSPAVSNEKKISPNDGQNLGLGFVMGIMIGFVVMFLLEFLDKTVKDERFVTETLGLPILGEISHISARDLQSSVGQVAVQVTSKEVTGQEATKEDMSDLMARRMERRERI